LTRVERSDGWDLSGSATSSTARTGSSFEPIDGGRRTRFEQSERFRGVLLPLVRRSVLPPTLRGFEPMNLALADRVAAMKVSPA